MGSNRKSPGTTRITKKNNEQGSILSPGIITQHALPKYEMKNLNWSYSLGKAMNLNHSYLVCCCGVWKIEFLTFESDQ